jgi:hypothetical protein
MDARGESMIEMKHAKSYFLISAKQDDRHDSLDVENLAMLRCSFKHQP